MLLSTRIFSLSCKTLNGNLFRAPISVKRLPCAYYVSVIPSKRPMREEKFAAIDKVPKGYKIIYRAPMDTYIKLSKYVSGSTAFLIGGLALFKFATDNKFIEISQDLELGGLVTHESDIWLFAAGFIAINASIMFCISKYPLRIYRNENRYVAIYEGLLPFSTNQYNFKQGDVMEYKNILNPWSLITYKIKNKTSMLLLDYFKTPSEFHQMCQKSK